MHYAHHGKNKNCSVLAPRLTRYSFPPASHSLSPLIAFTLIFYALSVFSFQICLSDLGQEPPPFVFSFKPSFFFSDLLPYQQSPREKQNKQKQNSSNHGRNEMLSSPIESIRGKTEQWKTACCAAVTISTPQQEISRKSATRLKMTPPRMGRNIQC